MTEHDRTASSVARKSLSIIPIVMRAMASEMRQGGHGVSASQVSLLGILMDGPFPIGALAEMHAVSTPTMSNTLTSLETRGWVNRVRSTTDRRVVMIQLTPEGRAVYEDIQRHTIAHLADVIADLPPEELHKLSEGLDILQAAFASRE